MRKALLLFVIALMFTSCSKDNKIEEPEIIEFSATPTTLPRRDTVIYTINAKGDNITFFDGKSIIPLSDSVMPVTHIIDKIRFNVSDTADTVWARLNVVNIYDVDNIKEVSDSIELILLNQ